METTVRTRTDVLEEAYSHAITVAIRGAILMAVCLILVWVFGFLDLRPLRILSVVGAAIGGIIILYAALRFIEARRAPYVTVHCPYCEHPMQFPVEPTSDYTCEGCDRRVYYENGKPAPVREVTCPVCKTVHKVSVKATNYTCDACNRPLRLTDPKKVEVVVEDRGGPMGNFDVLITDAGRNATEVAMALQSILVCNLPEARAQLKNLPLTVMRNVPELKADALRRRLRELGATAIVRPTAED